MKMKFGNSIFKTFFLSLCIIANTSFAYAQTASILPPAKTTFNDQNGKPLTSGTVDFYVPNTTTRKTTWQDSGETVPNTNPVSLDSAGRALILGDGSYRQVVKDRYGNLVWDQVTSSLGGGGSSGTSIGDGLSVGTILPTSAVIAPVNYQFAYGQTLSRASFPELLSALTFKTSVTCVGGSPIVTGIADTSSISVGTVLESVCATGSPAVISKTLTTVTLNSNATISTTNIGTFFIYGNGDALTTFNLPDLRGNTIAGRCNMGGVDCANLNSTYFSSNASNTPSSVNAKGGAQSTTILTGNLPPYTPSGSVANGAITTTVANGGSVMVSSGAVAVGGGGSFFSPTLVNLAATSTQAASSFTGTAQGGTSTALSVVQPTLTLNYVIKVSPDVNLSPIYGVASVGGMTGIITCGTGLTCAGNNISVSTGGVVTSLGGLIGNIGVAGDIVVSGSNIQTSFTQTGTGAVTQNISAKILKSGCVTPWDFTSATIDNGSTNAQPAIQLALNTGKCVYLPKPTTCYLVNSDLTMQASQPIFGDGVDVKTLCINSNAGFTNGLFNCNTSQPGNAFSDMRIVYTQADPTTAMTIAIPNGSNVMTVTGFTGAVPLATGQFIIDPSGAANAVPQGAFISTLGTGVGGNGTYNLSWTNTGTAISARAASTPDNMRPQLTQYKPTFACHNSARVTMARIQGEGAWTFGDFQGNSGGFVGDDIRISPFSIGLWFDGALDTVRADKVHCWPFNLTANQTGVFESTAKNQVIGTDYTSCLYLGRVDGFFANEFFDLAYQGITTFAGTGGPGGNSWVAGSCICNVTNSGFDSFNGITQVSGTFNLSNSYFSHYIGPYTGFIIAGTSTEAKLSNIYVTTQSTTVEFLMQNCSTCNFSISNVHFNNGSTVPSLFSMAATAVGASSFQVLGGYADSLPAATVIASAVTPNSGTNNFHMNNFIAQTTGNLAYTNPLLNIGTSVRYTITNNRVLDKGTGAGTFFNNATDCYCVLTGNVAPGWTVTVPVGSTGVYTGNPH